VQEVYDKKVVHRLVGVQPKTTVMQDDPQSSGVVHSKGSGASIVQSVWEPAERCEDTEEEGDARKRRSSTTALSREVIDVDADEEESRYDVTGRKGRKTREVIDVDTIFTTDEGSEDSEGASGKGGQGPGEQVPVKINRKRAFWASKAGTAAASLGT
jgi:non-canonical poly(A) RNA polymerase PAPD5/7